MDDDECSRPIEKYREALATLNLSESVLTRCDPHASGRPLDQLCQDDKCIRWTGACSHGSPYIYIKQYNCKISAVLCMYAAMVGIDGVPPEWVRRARQPRMQCEMGQMCVNYQHVTQKIERRPRTDQVNRKKRKRPD